MDSFLSFLKSYGFYGLLVVVVAFAGTALIKLPIKKWAEKWATKNGLDKSVVTKWISAIPLAISFIGARLVEWGNEGWGNAITLPTFDWTRTCVFALACWTASVSAFNIIGDFRNASLSKERKKTADATNAEVAKAKQIIAESAVTEKDIAKQAKKDAEAKAKAEEQRAKLIAKAEAEQKAREEKIAKLNAQIEALKGNASASAQATQSVSNSFFNK